MKKAKTDAAPKRNAGVMDEMKRQAGAQKERLKQWNKDRKRKGKKMNEESVNQEALEEQSAQSAPEEGAQGDREAATEQEAAAGQEMEQRLAEALAKCEEYISLAQRVQADFDNFRRRNNAVRAEAYEEGKRDTVEKLLPVLDNIERALAAAQDEESPLRSGVELVHKGLWETMQHLGVEVIDRQGEVFDPELENAVLQGCEDEGEPGTVCAVLQKGYKVGSRVVRHAMVKVVAG